MKAQKVDALKPKPKPKSEEEKAAEEEEENKEFEDDDDDNDFGLESQDEESGESEARDGGIGKMNLVIKLLFSLYLMIHGWMRERKKESMNKLKDE